MVWIVFAVLIALLGTLSLVLVIANGRNKTQPNGSNPTDGAEASVAFFGAMAVIGLVFIVITAVTVYNKVPENHVGIVYGIGGEIVDQIPEGVNIVAPWKSVKTETLQVKLYAPEEAFTAGSKEDLAISAVVALNYRVDAANVQELWSNVGPNWFDILVPQRFEDTLKQEFKKYAVLDITANRQAIVDGTTKRLQKLLDPFSITIVNLSITDIDFTPQVNASITDKQVAEQRALTERNLIALEEAQKERAIIRAEGDKAVAVLLAEGQADTTRIEAQGIADANRLVGNSINPQLLQWEAIKAMRTLDMVLLPAGEGLIIDPSTLLQGVASND